MASLKILLKELDAKNAELDNLKPIKKEWQRKLDDKYRLEWNFHSNRIEGNTLTYGQTQMLLFFGKATGEHEKRDYDEIEAHDVAIKLVTEWAKDETRDLTAAELRELNKIILVKPFWKEALTADGLPTRKEIIPGQYKSSPNSVRLKSGEIHHYASPEETPSKMDDLINMYSESRNDHPIVLAAKTHHQFTAIHPFDDGNGRVARLWINYILLRAGFPPLIIRVENKEWYLTALQKADTGELEPFVEYLINEMSWSLDKAIDAANERPLDEPGDLDKKLAILQREIEDEGHENEIQTGLTNGVVMEAIGTWGNLLIDELALVTAKFNRFYNNPRHQLSLKMDGKGPNIEFKDTISYDEISREFQGKPLKNEISKAELILQTNFGAYKKGGLNPFGCNYTFKIQFEKYRYEVYTSHFNSESTKQENKLYKTNLLHQGLSEAEIRDITNQWGNTLFEHLKYHREKGKGME